MSKIQEAAKAAFNAHPGVDEVYVTEDGNAFFAEVHNLAVDHARRNGLPAPVLVRREVKEVKEVKEEEEEKEVVPGRARGGRRSCSERGSRARQGEEEGQVKRH